MLMKKYTGSLASDCKVLTFLIICGYVRYEFQEKMVYRASQPHSFRLFNKVVFLLGVDTFPVFD